MTHQGPPTEMEYDLKYAIAKNNEILRCQVGSTAYGTNLDSADDDQVGIFIQPKSFVMGLDRLDDVVKRTAGTDSQRSKEGDTDLVIYSLRKWCALAAAGNPTMLNPLFAPVLHYGLADTGLGEFLRSHAHLFVSKQAGKKHLGYLTSQKEKMLGTRGNRTNRPELVEVHGFDTKFAYHGVRLGLQGVEFLMDGKVSFPVNEPMRSYLLKIRRGEVPLDEVVDAIEYYEGLVVTLIHNDFTIPETADMAGLNKMLIEMHERWWSR